jgi:hypothetical protein
VNLVPPRRRDCLVQPTSVGAREACPVTAKGIPESICLIPGSSANVKCAPPNLAAALDHGSSARCPARARVAGSMRHPFSRWKQGLARHRRAEGPEDRAMPQICDPKPVVRRQRHVRILQSGRKGASSSMPQNDRKTPLECRAGGGATRCRLIGTDHIKMEVALGSSPMSVGSKPWRYDSNKDDAHGRAARRALNPCGTSR